MRLISASQNSAAINKMYLCSIHSYWISMSKIANLSLKGAHFFIIKL